MYKITTLATVTDRLEEMFCLVSGEEKYGNLVSNELMILFILPPLDCKMDVSSVNFSVERRTRSIDKLTLWLRANARSKRRRFHLLTVDFDPYQLDSSSRLTYS